MSRLVQFPDPFAAHRRKGATLRAILDDTRDLLAKLSYADEGSRLAAEAQIEAINDVLTADTQPG